MWGEWEEPFLTLNAAYEAAQLRVFGAMVARGHIYRGRKPVHWSPSSRTALAEAVRPSSLPSCCRYALCTFWSHLPLRDTEPWTILLYGEISEAAHWFSHLLHVGISPAARCQAMKGTRGSKWAIGRQRSPPHVHAVLSILLYTSVPPHRGHSSNISAIPT